MGGNETDASDDNFEPLKDTKLKRVFPFTTQDTMEYSNQLEKLGKS
jgi:hypothetical protein